MQDFVVKPHRVSKDDLLKVVDGFGWTTGMENNSEWIHDGTSYLHAVFTNDTLVAFQRYGHQPTCKRMLYWLIDRLNVSIVAAC